MTGPAGRIAELVELLPRPLDPVRSLKLKISIVLLVSGGVGLAYLWLVFRWQPPVPISLVTVALVLLTAQVLAHGMTSPVRAMTSATRAMARGDYSRRIRATSRDEIGQLAAAFNRMAADLQTADQQRRELIGNVSHELRTPIAALQAVLENLVDGVATPDPGTLQTALSQTERLGKLVAELLDLSRLDAGVTALRLDDVPVADLVAEIVAEAEVSARVTDRGVRFVTEIRPEGARVLADRGRLHQVLANLLDNAARHGPAGSVVRVITEVSEGRLMIEVADQGPGIAPADRERVFDRFSRGERAGAGGTGLGLAIARWAVELHGGKIAVLAPEPDDGPGCRIRVTLPRAS